jgi:hypothetical protein
MRKSVHFAAAETGKQFVQTANTDGAGVPVYPHACMCVCVLRVCCVCCVCVCPRDGSRILCVMYVYGTYVRVCVRIYSTTKSVVST